MTGDSDFEEKLGVLIREDIIKLKKVKNKKEELEKIYKNYHKDDSKIENWNEAIRINTDNISRLDIEMKQIQVDIDNEDNVLKLLEKTKKDEIEPIEDERERKDKLNKINKQIEESIKKIEDLTDELQNKDQERSNLIENNEKLTEMRDNTINDTKGGYDDWQYSQIIAINSDDIYNVINDYFKDGNVNIDDFYRKDIVKDISVGIAPKINCVVRHTFNDINIVPNDVIVKITFNSGCYEIYNEAIEKGITAGNNTAVNIDNNSLLTKLNELEFIYNGNRVYKGRFSIYKRANADNEIDTYQLPFGNETVNIISNKLSSYSTKVDALRDIASIKTLLESEFGKYLYIYIVNVNKDTIDEKTKSIQEILNNYNKNMDQSSYVGFSKHTDENTGETYYINENETDPKKKNLKWVEELDTDGSPTGKLVLKYIDGVDTRARVIYDAQTGNISNGDNKSRYDQEYYFFRVLKDKDRMTYDKVMEKIQYFDPAFHSMTPEGFSARLNFLNQCMRAGNTVTASDGSYAKSANNLAFGRPPFCVLRLGDWYNQMIVIDNISISYDPLVWDLN